MTGECTPALAFARQDLAAALRGARAEIGRPQRRSLSWLVVAEIAGLLLRSFLVRR